MGRLYQSSAKQGLTSFLAKSRHCSINAYNALYMNLQAQLEILKMDFQEKKVNKNSFIEECEVVWDKMKEVGECEILCTPVKYCGGEV